MSTVYDSIHYAAQDGLVHLLLRVTVAYADTEYHRGLATWSSACSHLREQYDPRRRCAAEVPLTCLSCLAFGAP